MEEVKRINETKPATFRFTDDDVQKFKELASGLNLSQSEMFSGLVNNFEMDNAKQLIPDRAKEIETFQVTAEKMKSMFLNSLEINQTSESRIRETLALELKTKDQTIADFQAYKIDVKKQLDDSTAQAQVDLEKVATFEKNIKESEKTIEEKIAEAHDRQLQIKTLSDQLNYQTEDLTCFKKENIDLSAKNKTLETSLAADQLSLLELKSELVKIKNEVESISEQKEFYKTQFQKLESDIEKKDDDLKVLRDEQKHEIEALKVELRAEKEDAIKNALNLKTAEFELIKQKLDSNIAVQNDKNKLLNDQIAILQEKIDVLIVK